MFYTYFAVTVLLLTVVVLTVSFWRNRKSDVGCTGIICSVGSFIERYYLFFLFLIFVVFLFSRLFKLDSFPNGLHVDELSVAVDTKSILLNGTDRWGYRYPAYFYDYGIGQNALYVYVQAFIQLFLPCTVFVLRLQAVIWGVLCFFAMFGICYEITERKGYALIGPVLVTVLPMYFMSERWALEAYLFLPTAVITMYFLIRAVKHEKWVDWVLGGVFMGASLYTYAVSYMVWPIFLALSFIYLLYLKRISFKNLMCFSVPLVILGFPLVLYQLVNFRIIQPLHFLVSDYIPLPESRGQEMSISNIIYNLRFFRRLFLGGDELTYNAVPEFGTIYMFLIPFVLIGFVISIKDTIVSVKEKTFSPLAPVLFFWAGGTVFMLVVKAPNINRVNELFFPLTVFIFVGIYRLFARNAVSLVWLSAMTAASFLVFAHFYFCIQNSVYGYHLLHTNASAGKAIVRSEKYYCKDADTHIYIQFADDAISPYEQVFYFAAKRGDTFAEDDYSYGRVSAKLPEEIDVNENAVYIIGDQWPHIISYLISEGFMADQTLPGYSILFRLN